MFARALIVLLLMLNAGAALWWMARPSPAAETEIALSPGAVRLQLHAEAMAAEAEAVEPEVPDATGAVVLEAPMEGVDTASASAPVQSTAPSRDAPRCLAFGPFDTADAATAALSGIRPAAARSAIREANPAGGKWRVFVPPFDDRAAAVAMAERLRAAGFNDLYVISQGEMANAISLGRFGGESAARRHAEALQAAGFVEVRAEGEDPVTRYWIDAELSAGAEADALRRVSGAAQATALDCARIAR